MSALEDINKKFNNNEMLTACEQAIGTLWEDVSGYEWLAEEAATELAALEAVAEAAKKIPSVPPHWPNYGSTEIDIVILRELSAALAELEKARG